MKNFEEIIAPLLGVKPKIVTIVLNKPTNRRVSRPTITPLGRFESLSKAAAAHNAYASTILRKMETHPGEYYYEKDTTQ